MKRPGDEDWCLLAKIKKKGVNKSKLVYLEILNIKSEDLRIAYGKLRIIYIHFWDHGGYIEETGLHLDLCKAVMF